MGDVFKGRRRKIGVLTLMMALVFMGGWIRSQRILDEIELPVGQQTKHFLLSADERIGWLSNSDTAYRARSANTPTLPFSNSVYKFFNAIDQQWTFKWRGFWAGESTSNGIRVWMIPYWSITIPLTLLSAFLLLTKPQKTTPQTIPVPAEGA